MVESDVPYIVVLNTDTLESDIRVYYIRRGVTVLGNDENEASIGRIFKLLYLKCNFKIYLRKFQKIQVIKDENLNEAHCLFKNFDGLVTLEPVRDSTCRVNDIDVRESIRLCQGTFDRQISN